jgi:hypothetical protein
VLRWHAVLLALANLCIVLRHLDLGHLWIPSFLVAVLILDKWTQHFGVSMCSRQPAQSVQRVFAPSDICTKLGVGATTFGDCSTQYLLGGLVPKVDAQRARTEYLPGFHTLLLNVEVLNHGTPSTHTAHQPWYTTKQSYLNKPAPRVINDSALAGNQQKRNQWTNTCWV